GEILNVAQREDGTEAGRKALNRLAQDVSKFGLIVELFGVRPPLGEVPRDGTFVSLEVFVHGNGLAGLALAQAHEALIDGDADKPGRELRVPLELIQLLVSLEESVLCNVFGIFTVLSNVLRYAEDLALVLPDQLLESGRVPLFRALNKSYVGVNFLRCWGLDDGH